MPQLFSVILILVIHPPECRIDAVGSTATPDPSTYPLTAAVVACVLRLSYIVWNVHETVKVILVVSCTYCPLLLCIVWLALVLVVS